MIKEIQQKEPLKWLTITDIEYTPTKTSIIHDGNKMWDNDTVTTSAELTLKVDGEKHHYYVKSQTKCEAIQEALHSIKLQELIYNHITFKELNMENPIYETIEGETGNIQNVEEFYHNIHAEIHLINKEKILNELQYKADELIGAIIQ